MHRRVKIVFHFVVTFCLHWIATRAGAEDHADYRFELYQEDNNRITVTTHSALFDLTISPHLQLNGEYVADSISGATPTGAAPPNQYHYLSDADLGLPPGTLPPGTITGNTNSSAVPLTQMHDFRQSASLQGTISFGRHHFTPQLSYSEESDYVSIGTALNYSLDLNEKNTTLNLGWSRSTDRAIDDLGKWRDKISDDFLIGFNQLLGPKTFLTFNFTYGHSDGYLNDPYRIIVAANAPQTDANNPSGIYERRPSQRDKFIAYTSLTQFITPLHGSLEGSYRLYHDTFGVTAHTVSLAWYQKIGESLVLSPSFRYSRQSAADFYYEILPDINNVPKYFSPDYRLSEYQTFTYGLTLNWKVQKWLSIDAGYKRYIMEGLDNVTSKAAYPSANVFTVGARIWF